MIVIRILCFSKFTEIDLSHNVEEDVETEIEAEGIETKIEAEDVETESEAKDESPIGMYINLDNTRLILVYGLVNLCSGFSF